jgi:hypothetical protein
MCMVIVCTPSELQRSSFESAELSYQGELQTCLQPIVRYLSPFGSFGPGRGCWNMTGFLLSFQVLCQTMGVLKRAVRTPPNTKQNPVSGCPALKRHGQAPKDI